MNAKQSKVSKGVQEAIRGGNFYDDGVADGQDMGVTYQSVIANLARCKSPADKTAYRTGFMSGYSGVTGASESAARRQFYRLAKKHAPKSSNRQQAANAKKEAQAAIDAAAAPIAAVMSDKQCRQALMAATLFIAEGQAKPPADFLAWSAQLLAIITPKAVKSKGKSKAAPVEVLDADDDE